MSSSEGRVEEARQPECPECGGQGWGEGLVMLAGGVCDWERFECRACSGGGTVSAEFIAAREAGNEMRQARIARRQSLMDRANELGISPAELSAIEHGRRPIAFKEEEEVPNGD